ncbi:MAG: FAD-dependent oxidoreductase [Alphaproteobacteria bacterium]
MSGAKRLPAPSGSLIDRGKPIAFTFEGRLYEGFEGDTIASALLANGVRTLSRSFKYRRRRGVYAWGSGEAGSLVQLADRPNAPADRTPITDGLPVSGQNYSGSLAFDFGAWIGWFARFLPPGFYYRAFFRPRGIWRFWEKFIRRRAGYGRITGAAGHRDYDKAHIFADVAVIGAGPAGLSAALAAAEAGAEVVLVDRNPALGGSLGYRRYDGDGKQAGRVRSDLCRALKEQGSIRVLSLASCQSLHEDNWLPIVQGTRLWKLRAREVVIASGAHDGVMVFRNNDLPGIMTAGTAQRLLRHYGVAPGRRAIVATAGDDGYLAALGLAEAGIEVAAVLDLRIHPPDSAPARALASRQIEVLLGYAPYEARGRRAVSRLVARQTEGSDRREFPCDLLCIAAEPTPSTALLSHAGARPRHVRAAGMANGVRGLDNILADGRRAGADAAGSAGKPARAKSAKASPEIAETPIFRHPRGKEFVDLDEDLSIADIEETIALGYRDVQLLKRFSTLGMGPSQGRQANPPAIEIAGRASGQSAAAMGRPTARPPLTPEEFGVLAGPGASPVRLSPLHHRHIEAGARMMLAGAWERPAYYGARERAQANIGEEALAVRNALGLIDVSPLGKFEVRGREAAEFLNRIYTFAYKSLPVGRSRYLLMTDETGAITDDGVACRMEENHFYVTATTGGAEATWRAMLWWNAQWRLDVDIANVTAGYASLNLAGPKSRQALESLCDDIALSNEDFPYLGVRTGHVAGIPARLLRIGFVGELGYEIHVPASLGTALWDALMQAGQPFDIRPFGIEAQRLLRLEKGHIIVGQDSDGLTHPREAGMGWAIAGKKPFFVGRRAIDILSRHGAGRQLAGYRLTDSAAPLPKECHLVIRAGEIVGRVTSSAYSPTLKCAIGLAYLPSDSGGEGKRFSIRVDGGQMVGAEVTRLPFYDPQNLRQEQ